MRTCGLFNEVSNTDHFLFHTPQCVLPLFCFSSALFALTALFFFHFFFSSPSKCEANVSLLTEKKKIPFSHTRQRSNCVVAMTASNTNFTHELCSFKSIRQIVFLCLLSAGQAATFHQHAAKRRSLLGKHSCSCASASERLEGLYLSSQQCDTICGGGGGGGGARRVVASSFSSQNGRV